MTSNCPLVSDVAEQTGPGEAAWVRERLIARANQADWSQSAACDELIDWLYTVVRHRARFVVRNSHDRADITQNAMTRIFQALCEAHATIATRENPAAVLERIAAHAVEQASHAHRMAGYSGVAPNGQNWRVPYPRRVITSEGFAIAAPPMVDTSRGSAHRADRATEQIARWATERLGVDLNQLALDATAYVFDRLLSGLSRSSLLRGAHSSLLRDPAMDFLGLEREVTRAFAYWLLGQNDIKHVAPGVVDAALLELSPEYLPCARWREDALYFGLAEPVDRRPRCPRGGRDGGGRGIA